MHDAADVLRILAAISQPLGQIISGADIGFRVERMIPLKP